MNTIVTYNYNHSKSFASNHQIKLIIFANLIIDAVLIFFSHFHDLRKSFIILTYILILLTSFGFIGFQ